jgi:hypothetical protein
LSSPFRKNISVFTDPKSAPYKRHPVPKEGRRPTSQTWGRCDGRKGVARRAAFLRAAKPWGPGTPTLVSSSRDGQSRGRRWLTSPAHRGDHGVTVKPSRGECRFVSGEPVVTTLVCFVLFCMRGCGCTWHPAFPAPFSIGRTRNSWHTSGAWRREIAETRPVVVAREGGRSSTPRPLGSIAGVSGILGRPIKSGDDRGVDGCLKCHLLPLY